MQKFESTLTGMYVLIGRTRWQLRADRGAKGGQAWRRNNAIYLVLASSMLITHPARIRRLDYDYHPLTAHFLNAAVPAALLETPNRELGTCSGLRLQAEA